MAETTTKILLVDDDSDAVLSLARLLKAKMPSSSFEATAKIDTLLQTAQKFDPDVIILDLTLIPAEGPISGLMALSNLVKAQPFARVIVLTGEASIENGVKALERGAAHFLAKPAEIHHLLILIADAAALAKLKRAYQHETPQQDPLESSLVGKSRIVTQLREAIRTTAPTNQNVLITGETGTGKGVCAQALHRLSTRKNKPFIRYQPSFASGDLVLSELFGHRKGAFTGASEDRLGLLKRAEQGTLFLDEIDELPAEVQVALLGVIQEGHYRPLGTDKEVACDVRFIAATNRAVDESFEKGKLRKDLYFRLAQRQIHIAPLRERREDIIPLAEAILTEFSNSQLSSTVLLDEVAAEILKQHPFAGNVRELETLVRGGAYQALYRTDNIITPDDLRLHALQTANAPISFHDQITALKQQLVKGAMERSGNNQVQAAKLLALDRTSFRRILGET